MTPTPHPSTPPLFIVFNLGSGKGNAEEARRVIAEGCAAAGREHHLFVADDPSQIGKRVREALAGAQAAQGALVAAGGDGTINAVAQAALGSGCVFGVLPQGTFNYFSRTHGIPSDTAEALDVLLNAQPQAVQVGLVNERVFLVNASLGLYAKLLEDREGFKAQYGRSRWVAVAAALKTIARGDKHWDLRIGWRGEERNIRTPTLFVGNNALQLEQIGMPQAEAVEEGELAAIALKPIRARAMLWLMVRGAFGRLGEAANILSITFKSITVKPARGRPDRRVKVAADGEIQWMQMPLTFRVAPEPLWLLKPPPGSAVAEEARR
ncbi:MAG: diacylglycerol kinase [Variovorax sp.]|nr:MAG: diacylglycerol kinase [Variovorax sp.]